MERTFDRTDVLITAGFVAIGFAIVAFAAWQNRRAFAEWANDYRARVGATMDDATRNAMIAEEGITDGA